MKKAKKLIGTTVPQFTYDTPEQAENDFYALCAGETPLVLIFLPNFGHPISRHYLTAYLESFWQLTEGRLACVVRSNPEVMAERFGGAVRFPFPLICDADGVLYDYFEVRETTSIFDWTFAARRIINAAQKDGYEKIKGTPQMLPLTLILGEQGKVLYAHRARSLTDLPEDCEALQTVCQQLILREQEVVVPPAPTPTPQESLQGEAYTAPTTIDWFDAIDAQRKAKVASLLGEQPEVPPEKLPEELAAGLNPNADEQPEPDDFATML